VVTLDAYPASVALFPVSRALSYVTAVGELLLTLSQGDLELVQFLLTQSSASIPADT
jgi:hypothetical protein